MGGVRGAGWLGWVGNKALIKKKVHMGNGVGQSGVHLSGWGCSWCHGGAGFVRVGTKGVGEGDASKVGMRNDGFG
ncbi:hypothetical protein FNV43_RR14778 [Rhamnella rubrinervis]|uniref:Uncharacterized protein n=1 Tax=Rhamnella rubrinervis TaxID=2594499 RepID=A0A8K0MGP6_9ROSA|nr:hypothetical protein FNV43_RR14778 [Rhamnella rubrinervis]